MLVPMAKVEIIGPRGLFSDVLALVHAQGRLHIEDLSNKISKGDVPLNRMEVDPAKLREQQAMEDLLIRVRAILRALDGGGKASQANRAEYERLFPLEPNDLAQEVAQVINEVEDRTAALASAHTDLESELALLGRYEPILHKIQPLASQIVTTGSYDSVALLFERRYKGALEALKEELERITDKHYEVVSTDVDEDTTAAIVVFDRQYADGVHKFLTMENVNQIRLPDSFEGVPFDAAYSEVRARRQALPGELSETRSELNKMSEQWAGKLAAIRDVLIDREQEIEAIPKFGRTDYAFVITGWMPVKDVPELMAGIRDNWGDDIIVQQNEINEAEYAETPVALNNPAAIAPFQTLLSAYGNPRYGTIDATWMLFLFYPLFFGMIVGDFGYGIIMLSIILWLRFKFADNSTIRLATSILGPAATSVIIFGLVYGEFFGDLLGPRHLDVIQPLTIGAVTLPFERTHAQIAFMLIALAVGVVQILFGLTLGVINAVKTKNRHHLYEKGGILVFLIAIALAIVIGYAEQMFGSWTVWGQMAFAALALGGFIYAVRGGGVMGVVETVESVTHMASYLRIMAVGLAGALFADAVNGIVADMGNIALAIIVGVFLHAINFIIAAFSPTIHALRLNFLEFFGKFYETGKQDYRPFTKTGGEKSA